REPLAARPRLAVGSTSGVVLRFPGGISRRLHRALGVAGAGAAAPAEQAGRANRVRPEAVAELIDRAGQPLAPRDGRGAQRELPLSRPSELGHGEPDEPDGLAQRDAVEQCAGLAVDAEAVLSRLDRVPARDRGKVGEAELERDRAPRVAVRAELPGDALRLAAQRGPELIDVGVIAPERLLGAHGLG